MVNHNGYNDMASIQNNLDDILYMDAQMIRCLFCLAFFFVFFYDYCLFILLSICSAVQCLRMCVFVEKKPLCSVLHCFTATHDWFLPKLLIFKALSL